MSIPVKVKNVTVYAYIDPREPLTEVVISGASGTYSVGSLGLNIFYNLDLTDGGKRQNPVFVHNRYFATCESEDGTVFTTPWMYCLDNSDQPKFGRTVTAFSPNDDIAQVGPLVSNEDDYIKLSPLTNITVSQLFPPPLIGQRTLIEDGSGYIIATRIGTPHLMGVQVDTGKRVVPLIPGMKNVIITGKTADGHHFSNTGYTVVSAGEPAIFLQEFPG